MLTPEVGSGVHKFWRVIETLAVTFFLASLAVMFIQVTSRYAIGTAVPWTDETSRFFFIGAIYLGAAICQLHSTHIRVTVVIDMVSPGTRRWLEVIQSACVAVVSAALVGGCIEMAINSSNLRAATLPITFAWLYSVQGFGMLMILILALRDTWRLVQSPTFEETSK